LRFWPQKTWKKILLVFFLALLVVIAASIAFLALAVLPNINKDVVSGIDVINPSGSKTALVVYQPGYTGFPKDISYAFADGLASAGWRVEITTASSQAPSDLSGYSLLVLGFPVYGGKPGDPIVRYINRTSDLNGIRTVIIALDGLNSPAGSVDTLKQKVQAVNGTFYESLTLWIGNFSAADIARQAGSKIAP
jgi:flavorubredoxin